MSEVTLCTIPSFLSSRALPKNGSSALSGTKQSNSISWESGSEGECGYSSSQGTYGGKGVRRPK